MAQVCESRRFDFEVHYPLRKYKTYESIILEAKQSELVGEYGIFKPTGSTSCEDVQLGLSDLRKRLAIEKWLLDMSLEKANIDLCSKLRASVGLSKEYEGNETAIADLDSFLSDLAGEEVDASEIVRAARRHL